MARNERGSGSSRSGGESSKQEDFVALYLGRLNDGEALDRDQILADHPDLGEEILRDLDAFVGMTGGAGRPLGALGDYILCRQIGRGGMGVVYEAWENSMDRAVALKVLPAGVAADDRVFQRFVQEAKTAGRLSHRNIVPVYSTGVKEGAPWYSMELVEGETLAQLFAGMQDAESETATPFGKKGSLAYYSNLADAFAEVADGLQHAHSKGVTHRDIKPSNLILDADGRLRILDFGLARLEGQEGFTVSGDVVGTPLYMSPEQARRKKVPVDHRTDVYSLGATMYEAVCGRPPFRGKDHADTLSQIIERDPMKPRKVNPRVPKDLETIVLKCLRKDSGDRYGTAEALAQDLRRFVRGDPIEAKAESLLTQLLRRTRRRRALLVASLASVLLAIVSAGLFSEVSRRTHLERHASYERDVQAAGKLLLRGATTRLGTFEGAVGVRSYSMQPLVQPDDYARLWSSEERGPLEQAIARLEDATASVPERFEGYYYLARARAAAGRKSGAIRALEACLERRPGFEPALSLARALGIDEKRAAAPREEWGESWSEAWRSAADYRWDDAATAYDELRDRFGFELYLGSAIELHLARGIALQRAGRDWDALEAFLCAREIDPGFLEPWLLLASVYERFPATADQAETTFERLLAVSDNDDEAIAWIAATSVAMGNLESALRWSERIRDDLLRLRIESRCLLYYDDTREALSKAEEAFGLYPDDLVIRENLAFALGFAYGQLDTEEAVRARSRALALMEEITARLGDPCATATLVAGLQCKRGRRAEMLEFLDRCIDASPRPPLFFARAVVHWWRSDWARVIADYRAGRAAIGPYREPISSWASLGYVQALQRSGEPRAAAREIELIVARAPRWAPARFSRGKVLLEQGRQAEAIEHFEASVDLYDPVRPHSVEWLSDALLQVDRLADAERRARTLMARRPDSWVGFECLGDVLRAQGRHLEAVVPYAQACVRRVPRNGRNEGVRKLACLLRSLEEAPPAGLGKVAAFLEEKRLRGAAKSEELGLLALTALRTNPSPDMTRARELADAALATAASPSQKGEALATLAVVERACGKAVAFRTLERALRYPGARRESAELLARWRGDTADLPPALPGEIDELEAFVHGNPLFLEAHLSLTEALFAAGRREDAEQRLDRLLLEFPESGSLVRDAWLDLGLHRLGRSAGELLGRLTTLTGGVAETPRHLEDLRWLLVRRLGDEILRINCGGQAFEDGLGRAWSKDRFFVGGRETAPCLQALDETLGPLHQSSREFDDRRATDVAYRVPLPNGRYTVRLHLAERQVTVAGARRFDVRLEGRDVLGDYDPYAELGLGKPGRKEFKNIDVIDGKLELELVARAGSARLYGLEIAPTSR